MRSRFPILLLAILLVGCHDEPNLIGSSSPPPDNDLRPMTLSIPKLSLGVGIETGDYQFSWTSSSGATFYTLQSDLSPIFSTTKVVYSGSSRTYYLGFKSNYFFSSYYRVRAETETSRSNWSDIIRFPE